VNKKLEELIINSISNDNREPLDEILQTLNSEQKPLDVKITSALSLIIEAWQINPSDYPNTTEFITKLPKFYYENFQLLRTVLPSAIKKTISKEINSAIAINILGIRDEKIALVRCYKRFVRLCAVKPNTIFYTSTSNTWGIIKKIDWVTESLFYTHIDNDAKLFEADISTILEHIFIFKNNKSIKEVIKAKSLPDSKQFINTLTESSILPIKIKSIKKLATALFVPSICRKPEDLDTWIQGIQNDTSEQQEKTAIRSIQELYNYLSEQAKTVEFNEGELKNFSRILSLIKSTSSPKEFLIWAESLTSILAKLNNSQLNFYRPSDEIEHLVWPSKITAKSKVSIEIWTKLKSVETSQWIRYTRSVKGDNFLLNSIIELPWKVWSSANSELGSEFMEQILGDTNKISSSEAMLWLIKNMDKVSENNKSKINYSNILSSINKEISGAVWLAASKELRKQLLENTDLQKIMFKEKSDTEFLNFIEVLNITPALSTADKSSLIVKLSRQLPEFKQVFESDKAKKIMSKGSDENDKQQTNDVFFTSQRSYVAKIQELNDIINIHMPENTEAIATARAHGDLRENAEFSAAKERQKVLGEQRSMLEYRIAKTRPMDFSEVVVTDTVIIGCSVYLKYETGSSDYFHILGSWDSEPKKKYMSYETEMGKALIGKKTGGEATLPDGTRCTIDKITKLDNKIINELNTSSQN